MKIDEIRWALIDRENLLDVLLGDYELMGIISRTFPGADLIATKLAVGYKDSQFGTDYAPPSLIIVPDNSEIETLSWLRTFSNEVFPMSQFARVARVSDWLQFDARSNVRDVGEKRPDCWASIMVGEALSQIEGEINLGSLPLSRLAGCFTTPIARAALIWENDDATRICSERLRKLEEDRRFSRRSVGVDDLVPVWSIAAARIRNDLSPWEAAAFIIETAGNYFAEVDKGSTSVLSLTKESEFSALASNSVEERVGAFLRLSSKILNRTRSGRNSTQLAINSVVLAVAAFLVGRGTSHVFLLPRVQRFAPTAAAWFGVLAALVGLRAWDPIWLKAVKGAERFLRPEFNWLDVPSADVCWGEFAWLARTFEGTDIFLNLPKMLPRTLNIEIVPGATCQFRIGNDPIDNESKQAHAISARENSLSDAIEQFLALAKRIESQLETSLSTPHGTSQRSLKLNDEVSVNKSQRIRKYRKIPDSA